MSRARRKSAGDPGTAQPDAAQHRAADPFAAIGGILILALIVVRWLVPTESAADGETLWIVQLWFAAAGLWAWSRFRSGNWAVRLNAFDAALWILIAGHLVSTAVVFKSGGDRRAALNIAWEWLGLGVTFFLLRQIVPENGSGVAGQTSEKGSANRLALVVATLGVVLAGLGIWQHYVYYPRAYEEYRGLTSELDKLQQNPAGNGRRIGELELKLQAQGVPSERAGRQQFENRLRFSNEAFGPFALANTFAGFLFVAIILAADRFRAARRPLTKVDALAWAGVFLLLVYCLVLTKSRTAWIALVVALVFWGTCAVLTARAGISRRMLLVGAGILAALAMLIAVAAVGKGFDVQVISEAPLSLSYRLQYWKGALGVVREHPIFGTGPGNFRQHYLRYKVPESSEAIADPHNLVFDLWTSGGLLALIGFLGCVLFAVTPFLRRRRTGDSNGQGPQSGKSAAWADVVPGVASGFLLAIVAPVLSASGDFDVWQLLLFAAWLIAFAVLRRRLGTAPLSAAALGGAALGLCVHLLGAGGIEMPAVVQLFLVIAVLAFASAPNSAPNAAATRESRALVLTAGGGAIILFIGCVITATLPVLNRRALVASGEQAILLDGDTSRAILDFATAALRDPLSPDPPEKMAEAFFSRWQSGRPTQSVIDDFAKAERSLETAIHLDPFNSRCYRRWGEMDLAKFARSGDRHDAEAAAKALAQAVERDPNDSSLRALRATALSDAGQTATAKAEAERALLLDQINHQWNHTDIYLPDATVLRLRQLASHSGP